jgi:hypothetical protein
MKDVEISRAAMFKMRHPVQKRIERPESFRSGVFLFGAPSAQFETMSERKLRYSIARRRQ